MRWINVGWGRWLWLMDYGALFSICWILVIFHKVIIRRFTIFKISNYSLLPKVLKIRNWTGYFYDKPPKLPPLEAAVKSFQAKFYYLGY